MGKYFGTDGVRGVANQELTVDFALDLGKALGLKLRESEPDQKIVVIGQDTRQSGDMLKSALVAGLNSMGLDCYDLGVIPTPAVAYLTRYYKAAAGIMISASHNPYEYNGIKIFGSKGFKLSDALENEIEERIDEKNTPYRISPEEIGQLFVKKEAIDLYLDHLISLSDQSFEGLILALDCGNGATAHLARPLFEKLGAKVYDIHITPDGTNINDGCGSTNPQEIIALVQKVKADAGLSFDGDGDRIIMVDEKGQIMDGDHILAALAEVMLETDSLKNHGVVGTVMSNIGLKTYLKKYDVRLIEAPVGDRYVLEEMLENDYVLGGEQSGHILFLDHNTTGDGLQTGVKVIETMVKTGKKLSALNECMTSYPQVLKNARVCNERKEEYRHDPVLIEAMSELTEKFEGEGRVLIRPSGTEPLIRVMIEGKDEKLLLEEADKLVLLIEERLKG